MHPLPPLPPRTWTRAWSRKIIATPENKNPPAATGGLESALRRSAPLLGGNDVNESAAPTLLLELHHPRRHGEQSVVLAAAHVGAGKEDGAALADDDRA